MQPKSYIRFNSLINVDYVKIDTQLKNSLEQARIDYNLLDSDFIIQSKFSNEQIYGVDADYFDNTGEGAISMVFYKKTPSQQYYDFICDLPNGYLVTDYNIVNGEYYHYLVAVQQLSETGVPIYRIYQNIVEDEDGKEYPAYEKAKWSHWSICDIEESAEVDNLYIKSGTVWKLKYNAGEESLNQNLNITSWETLNRYPKISQGDSNYESGSVTCLLGDIVEYAVYNNQQDILNNNFKLGYGYTERNHVNINPCIYNSESKKYEEKNPTLKEKEKEARYHLNPYASEMDKLNEWKKFCSNGKLKLLKDPKGNAWVVEIIGVPNNVIDNISNIKQTTVSFEWQEVLDRTKISIIGFDSFKKQYTNDYAEDYIQPYG